MSKDYLLGAMTSLFCISRSRRCSARLEGDGDAADGDQAALRLRYVSLVGKNVYGGVAHPGVVRAAHRVGRALSLGNADNGNRRAADADQRVDAAHDNAE